VDVVPNLVNSDGEAVEDASGSQEPVLLTEPRDGLPEIVADPRALRHTVAALAAGEGPVAVDAERASGYRYTQRAYLVQLRRHGAGVALIDPVACPDLSAVDAALDGAETVLHAAQQDLPCLQELGFRPRRLFDTELAGRLLGYPRVALGVLVERLLGVRLAKEHSAADWSVRPLPEDWLRYAALDVELLIELRDALAGELEQAHKLAWAHEEFEAVLAAKPKAPRPDPWRRTSGIHRVRSQRGLAAVRELWSTRDRIARELDLAPGRVLHDKAIVEAALAMPRSQRSLHALPSFHHRRSRDHSAEWAAAVERARTCGEDELPRSATPGDGPPPSNRWAERAPEAARRLEAARAVVQRIAEEVSMPAENLLHPDTVRRVSWEGPEAQGAEAFAERLRSEGAREWQITLTSADLARAFAEL
jgi:ribonuclease D